MLKIKSFKHLMFVIWKSCWYIPILITLFLLCILTSIFNLDYKEGFSLWGEIL